MREYATAPDAAAVLKAIQLAGEDKELRGAMFEALRRAEAEADDPLTFREAVRWPLVRGMLGESGTHAVTLSNGLTFEVGLDSRIERALLLSRQRCPDHVWEPQTTKLLLALAAGDVRHVLVGGAYIGDHALPLAQALHKKVRPGTVHAFEPMPDSFQRLLRNRELNGVTNLVANHCALWDESGVPLQLSGPAALTSTRPTDARGEGTEGLTLSTTIDDYVNAHRLEGVGLIMLDMEGAEERALRGARTLLARPGLDAPQLVFEVHRSYTDWSNGLQNTSVVRMLTALGYDVYAVRDLHDNYPMDGQPVEIIPASRVYLEGPPHGFNLLATKEASLAERLDLQIVYDVSPKLLLHSASALHHPASGFLAGARGRNGTPSSGNGQ